MSLDFWYTGVSWVLLRWHSLFMSVGLSQGSGLGWALSIVFLVITARLLLFRPFLRQLHSTRKTQAMQPKIQQLREQYKHDRVELNRQMMKLRQDEGFNPLSGCLPVLLQIPIFLGLYHVLRHISNSVALCVPHGSGTSALLSRYTFNIGQTCSAARANMFGAPLSASFHDSAAGLQLLGGDLGATRLVILSVLLVSAAATLLTQLVARASATNPPVGTTATVQKLLTVGIPISVLASGLLFSFPLGVLLYWFTSNLWTLGQQLYINKYHPPKPPTCSADPTSSPTPSGPTDDSTIPKPRSRAPGPRVGQRPATRPKHTAARKRPAKKR